MQQQESDAPEALRNSVQGGWYRQFDFGTVPAAFEVLPDGHSEIVFHFGNGCSLVRNGRAEPLSSPFIVGLLDQPVCFQSKGQLQLIGIKCLPWAIYDLLGIPAAKKGVQNLSHPISLLQPALHNLLQHNKVQDALSLIFDWLITATLASRENALLNKAGKALLQTNGALPVSAVAAAAHATVRTLERKFKASSGHTVKDVAGLMRFEQARDRLWAAPETSVAGLAHELGYADQSHLNREFKRYSGITAATFARQTKERKKEQGDNFVAIVLS